MKRNNVDCANKFRNSKYKSEYIIKLVGVYICQKWHLMANSISKKMGIINGKEIGMNYINVNHLFQLYDIIIYVIGSVLYVWFVCKQSYIFFGIYAHVIMCTRLKFWPSDVSQIVQEKYRQVVIIHHIRSDSNHISIEGGGKNLVA